MIDDARFFEINATVTLRRGKLITGNYVLRRHMTNGAAIEALMQGPKVKVVKTFDVTSRRASRSARRRRLVGESGFGATTARRPARAEPSPAPASSACRRAATRSRASSSRPPTAQGRRHGARPGRASSSTRSSENFGSLDLKRAQRKNLTRYDVVTIASMIERETPLRKERPLIASVIYNRLSRASRSASTRRSATTRTTGPGRSTSPSSSTTRRTTRGLNRGLPPTPIGNPGLASLKAAAQPGEHRLPVLHGEARRVPRLRRDLESTSATSPPTRRRRRRQGPRGEVLTTYLGVAGWPVAHSRSPRDAQRRARGGRARRLAATSAAAAARSGSPRPSARCPRPASAGST